MFRTIPISDLESQDDGNKDDLKSYLFIFKIKPTGYAEVSETEFLLVKKMLSWRGTSLLKSNLKILLIGLSLLKKISTN